MYSSFMASPSLFPYSSSSLLNVLMFPYETGWVFDKVVIHLGLVYAFFEPFLAGDPSFKLKAKVNYLPWLMNLTTPASFLLIG